MSSVYITKQSYSDGGGGTLILYFIFLIATMTLGFYYSVSSNTGDQTLGFGAW